MNFDQYLNRYLWMSVVFLFLHGLITHNPVEANCGLILLTSVIVCDVLEYRDRVFYRDAYNQTLRDANRDLESMLANMRSIDVQRNGRCRTCGTPELCLRPCTDRSSPYIDRGSIDWRDHTCKILYDDDDNDDDYADDFV